MSEKRRRERDPRQKTLIMPAVDLPLPVDPDDPPFLRPARRTRVRRARRGWTGRTVLALEITAGVLTVMFLSWAAYAKVMGTERLRVARVEVRGSHFLSEGEVREIGRASCRERVLLGV